MLFRDLLILAAPYRLQIALLAALSIVSAVVTLAIPALGASLLGGMYSQSGQ